MLYLEFILDSNSYLIPANAAQEVLPLVALNRNSRGSEISLGLINCHGSSIRVIDLCYILLGRPCREIQSARILVLQKKPETSQSALLTENLLNSRILKDEEFECFTNAERPLPWCDARTRSAANFSFRLDLVEILARAGEVSSICRSN